MDPKAAGAAPEPSTPTATPDAGTVMPGAHAADPSAPGAGQASVPPPATAPEVVDRAPAGAVPPGTPPPPTPRPGLFGPRAPVDPVRRRRTQVKMVGVFMVLFGALFGFQFYGATQVADHRFVASEVGAYAGDPGGLVVVELVGVPGANVTFAAFNATVLGYSVTNATGMAQMAVSTAAVNVTVMSANSTWVRSAFVPDHFTTRVRIDPDSSPASQAVADSPDFSGLRLFWVAVAAAILVLLGGVAAVMMRVFPLALAGAATFLLGSLVLASYFFGLSIMSLLLLASSAYAVWSIYKAKSDFVRAGAPRAPAK